MSVTKFTSEELDDLHDEVTLPLYVLFPSGALGLYSLAFPWPVNTLSVYLNWLAFTTFIFFCYTSCFHETVHQKLSQSVGRSVGASEHSCWSNSRHADLHSIFGVSRKPYSPPRLSE